MFPIRLRSIVILGLFACLTIQLKYALFESFHSVRQFNGPISRTKNGGIIRNKHTVASEDIGIVWTKLFSRSDPEPESSSNGDSSNGEEPEDSGDGSKISDNEEDLDTPADDDVWDMLIAKGCKLLGLIEMSSTLADTILSDQGIHSQTQFTDFTDLQANGWDRSFQNEQNPFQNYVFMTSALNALGLSQQTVPQGGTNNLVQWSQDHSGTYNGHSFSATTGRYLNIYNPTLGTIFALQNYSPLHPENPPSSSSDALIPPPLKQWSDVTYLEYARQATSSSQLTNLRYIFRNKIDNLATRQAISRALRIHSNIPISFSSDTNNGEDSSSSNGDNDDDGTPRWYPGPWPGVTFDTDTDEGKALLATPNVGGVAWLLIQHKEVWKGRTVREIQVFEDEDTWAGGGGGICMLVRVVEV
ncbi:MAG: hypothetical protein M1820_008601 [Bogoriella megaspora]|nr:MAG: hypothetical protein M1820_008601 [Bogoriella megaspora]